VVAKKLQELI